MCDKSNSNSNSSTIQIPRFSWLNNTVPRLNPYDIWYFPDQFVWLFYDGIFESFCPFSLKQLFPLSCASALYPLKHLHPRYIIPLWKYFILTLIFQFIVYSITRYIWLSFVVFAELCICYQVPVMLKFHSELFKFENFSITRLRFEWKMGFKCVILSYSGKRAFQAIYHALLGVCKMRLNF